MAAPKVAAALLAASMLLLGCSGGDDDDAKEPTVTSPVSTVAGSRCSLTSVDEVREIFGGPVGAAVVGDACSYEIGTLGSVRFNVRTGDDRPLTDILTTGQAVADVGDEAVWSALAANHGVVLVMRSGKAVVQIEALLSSRVDEARVLASRWGRAIAPRLPEYLAEAGSATTGAASTDACDLLPEARRQATLGRGFVAGPSDSSSCTFQTAAGGSIIIGPLTEPASGEDLLAAKHLVSIDGKQTEWPITPVDGVGDAAVALTDPGDGANLDLYVLSGARLLRVSAYGPDATQAQATAKKVAEAVLADR